MGGSEGWWWAALSKQPSRLGEVSQREEKCEEPEIKRGKYIYEVSVGDFLRTWRNSDSRKSGGEFSPKNLLQTLYLLMLTLKGTTYDMHVSSTVHTEALT